MGMVLAVDPMEAEVGVMEVAGTAMGMEVGRQVPRRAARAVALVDGMEVLVVVMEVATVVVARATGARAGRRKGAPGPAAE